MQKKIRPDPLIPDHEVLRKIGGGSYGEVWLARGVTGAMRAVKIVYREDFSDDRTFEREFEGILRFEPISRDHRGFVNILHVGRSDGDSAFYYYVMELGDDAHSDGELNPVEYEPRTLRTDMKRSEGAPLGTQFCIETGRRLAEALGELHDRGLTHRDIKPSNVIFVEGKAKLADIGLVAAKDQRTFVGTEGFVPPEGPGSEGADIYALGKVLYEMATGMDRLQFPELPAGGPGDDERKKWIKLNRLLCDICDPRVAKRKITNGSELATSLARLLKGKSAARKISPQQKLVIALVALLGLIGSQLWIERTWGTHVIEGKREPLPTRYVTVKVLSSPSGAVVKDLEGNYVTITPGSISNVEVGSNLKLNLTAKGYRDYRYDAKVVGDENGSRVVVIECDLELFSPPKNDEIWEDALGELYYPDPQEGDRHESQRHVSFENWEKFRNEEGNEKFKPIPFKYEDEEIVAVPEEWAKRYSDWLMKKCIRDGFFEQYSETNLGRNREIVPVYDLKFPENKLPAQARKGGKTIRPFRCLVRPIPYGIIRIDSTPQEAVVYFSDGAVRTTPVERPARPGNYSWTVELGGYETDIGEGILTEDGEITYHHALQEDQSVIFGKPWTNSLGMEMVPLGEDLMVAVWETRSSDFQRYLESKKEEVGQIIVSKNSNEPVVAVTREDCERFCEWLTESDKQPNKQKRIKKNHRYRLPTDEEWSRFVGLVEDVERLEDREFIPTNEGIYPWGQEWPPPFDAGNYADLSAAIESLPSDLTISDFDDNFPRLAPVGQFKPNELGIYDLGGNVYEWVSDDYISPGRGILRGGSWKSFTEDMLESRFRYPINAKARDVTFGFRVVLAKEAEEAQNTPETLEEDDGGNSD